MVDPALVAGVELLCLDAGNTIIFLDHARLGELSGLPADALIRSEGEAKRLAETGELLDVAWNHRDQPGALGWGRMVGTIVYRGGMPAENVSAFLDVAWSEHGRFNLWCKVPAGLPAALERARRAGVKVAVISNSEGMLEKLFEEIAILSAFDLVVDSGKVGVEKPDPRIFQVAFDRFGIPAERALHLGDVFATDVLGARAAGCRHALIDPFGHYEGRHLDVPRVAGAAEVADALVSAG